MGDRMIPCLGCNRSPNQVLPRDSASTILSVARIEIKPHVKVPLICLERIIEMGLYCSNHESVRVLRKIFYMCIGNIEFNKIVA